MISTINNVKDPSIALIAVLDKLVSISIYSNYLNPFFFFQNSPIIIKNYMVD